MEEKWAGMYIICKLVRKSGKLKYLYLSTA